MVDHQVRKLRHLACGHLTSSRRAVALGEIGPLTPYDDPRADVLRQRGILSATLDRIRDQARV